jgi:isoamylase
MARKASIEEKLKVSEGKFYPLGATPVEGGVNFALYSKHATEVTLLLYDHQGKEPTHTIRLENRTRFIWHAFVHGLGAGQLYGYRVDGPFDPRMGLRFNSNKLLLDPYAKAITAKMKDRDGLLLSYDPASPGADLSFDERDNSAIMPRSIVIDDSFDWQGDKPLEIPLEKSFIYEVHPKGFTAHRSSAVKQPGTYLGFIEKIPYLKKLGITAVELLPVQEFLVDGFLQQKGLTNYWGYNTIGFFAPESSYATQSSPGCQVREFKMLVRELHRAGIEVILDVVYNHTGEGNELGPTISFKGVDNLTYYALTGGDEEPYRYYMNYTGCGNSIDACNPQVIRLITDSLRYWVETMHVDGFRFDLATVLGRRNGQFSSHSTFFDVLSQDPVLNRVKLIAEPWDVGTYQVGNFPVDWSEWNGKFRDTARRFIKGDGNQLSDFGRRLWGSSDLYGNDGRTPYNSINFITCHDGFTLADIVSYSEKHNEANGEDNRDGSNDNYSWNWGVEGETDYEEVLHMRRQIAKNLISTLFLSLGTPMLLSGDEVLRSQAGNNNAYCQDNEISWFDWTLVEKNAGFLEFCRHVIQMIKNYKALQLTKYFKGVKVSGLDHFDMHWFGVNGGDPDWHDPEGRTVAFQIHAREKDAFEYYFMVIFNSDWRSQCISLPSLPPPFTWHCRLDTSLPEGKDFIPQGKEIPLKAQECYEAAGRSIVVLLAMRKN